MVSSINKTKYGEINLTLENLFEGSFRNFLMLKHVMMLLTSIHHWKWIQLNRLYFLVDNYH